MKKIISLILCGILAASAAVSCDKRSDKEAICGTWSHTEAEYEVTITFNSDKTYTKELVSNGIVDVPINETGKYAYDGITLKMISDKWKNEVQYKASCDDSHMTWDTGEIEIEYTKK